MESKYISFDFIIWVMLYLASEYINLHIGLIFHHNGWSMWHSIPFVIAMFVIFPSRSNEVIFECSNS